MVQWSKIGLKTGRNNSVRSKRDWLKIVLSVAVLTALGSLAISCGNGGAAHVRVINAISNTQGLALDVYVNGGKINSSGLAYQGVYPSQTTPAAYSGVPAGSNTFAAFDTGTTTNPVLGSGAVGTDLNGPAVTVSGGNYYTVLLSGSVNNTVDPPAVVSLEDHNENDSPPATGNVSFRVINASASSTGQYPEGFDVYFEPDGAVISGTPQISSLTYQSDGPGYITLSVQTSYTVYVTAHGSQEALFSGQAYGQTNQQITTLVIFDNEFGSGLQKILELIDLN